jgi:hypothetical protein
MLGEFEYLVLAAAARLGGRAYSISGFTRIGGTGPFLRSPVSGSRAVEETSGTWPSILLAQGVADSVVAKVTGHRSAALRRYQHLSESFRKQTVDLIASF